MKRFALSGLIVAVTSIVSSCGDGETGNIGPPASDQVETVGSEALNVLVAGAILSVGDVDRAIAEGLVSPDEVDAAIEAFDNREFADLTERLGSSSDDSGGDAG